ncbi:hypothetical protein LX32DRAFT_382335 [Colletotrichum zoysiae]|uniref:Uncharacterized protein n=1 Tax=Colletotrichum zoysiae TaxID=1216348 RepID=A0AAD9M540_9PEZI|nr:hypothetical protein LX32DRAFT_382335 [Colletotrichum zoysiae]
MEGSTRIRKGNGEKKRKSTQRASKALLHLFRFLLSLLFLFLSFSLAFGRRGGWSFPTPPPTFIPLFIYHLLHREGDGKGEWGFSSHQHSKADLYLRARVYSCVSLYLYGIGAGKAVNGRLTHKGIGKRRKSKNRRREEGTQETKFSPTAAAADIHSPMVLLFNYHIHLLRL